MIPKLEDVSIGQKIEITQQPTLTYKIDFEKNRIVKIVDGIEAMKQTIYLILNTERYQHEIYDWNYGFEVSDLVGKPRAFVYPEFKRRIREALMVDDRITGVDDFEFSAPSRGVVAVSFTVHTVFGDINMSRGVRV